MSWQQTLLDLVDDHLTGRLDERGRIELERLLGEHAEARRLFWVATNHEVMLRSAFAHSAIVPLPAPVPAARHWWRRSAWAAAALLLITIGAAVWGWRSWTAPQVAVISGIATGGHPGYVHVRGKQTSLYEGLPLHPGERIVLGAGTSVDLRWRHESTTITLSDSADAIIATPDEHERLRLDRGTVVAEIAHQEPGQRFIIATPQAQITVIGTRFVVHTTDDRTEVDVEQGRVRVATLAGDKPVEIGAGERAVRIAGQAPTVVPSQRWEWKDRRPIGVMMLSGATPGFPGNPRGWFNDQAIDVTTPTGLAAFQTRIDAQMDLTIDLLREQDAQGVVFWDLEGREHLIGYVGDPRQLARFAPEMDAAIDRLMQRLRDAGFSVGVALRAQEAVWEDQGRTPNLRTVGDPAGLLLEKIAYARKRWNATLFPIMGQSGNTTGMETITRRVVAAHPDILLMPTVGDADTYRWCGAWQDPQAPSTPEPSAARRSMPGAFGVYKALDAAQMAPRHDELVRAVAAGDILTFRAWWRDPANAVITRLRTEARALSAP